jgi:predicted membrane-bound spermidine synthase
MYLLFSLLSLLSAFLLFQVQPVISKYILPWFGGSPGVWTTCMLFFQIVLFGGYAYAHGLSRLSPKKQWIIHSLLILLALAFIPIAPGDFWKPRGGKDPASRILLLLLGTVGLPYFVLSSTSPLTQVWFTRAMPGSSPWRLYALSNLGSLAALLSYPFFFEPRWDVGQQTWMWSGGFVVFALVSLWLVRHSSQAAIRAEAEPKAELEVDVHPGWWRRLLWLLLPAVASALLLAATNHVSQDVAVVPFMWVAPLSLYLITFIICFEHERWYVRPVWAALAVVAILVTALDKSIHAKSGWDPSPNYLYDLAWIFGAVFLGCLVCHGELARLKPRSSRLTEFYLFMSAGGALGGLLVSQVAPRVFVTYLEWPLGLIVAFIVAAVALILAAWSLKMKLVRWALCIVLIAHAAYAVLSLADLTLKVDDRLERVRNFYGAVNVDEDWDSGLENTYRTLTHGGIIHGMQNLGAELRDEPVTYYGRESGIGLSLETLKNRPEARVGIVGMGAGTAACYAQSGQKWRFYEINPEIPRLARKHFTYLSDAEKRGAQVDTVIGDARLMLDAEESQQFDVLLLDAFSGDAIPVHLLTKEAFAIYKRHMKPDGILVVHVTNSYLALAPVVEKLAADIGWKTTRIIAEEDGDQDSTDYMMITLNEAFLKATPADEPEDPEPKDVPLWTDKRHNLFQILMLD